MKIKKMNTKAQELSAHWTMEWFIQNILLFILFFLIVGIGFYLFMKWLTSY